MQRIAFITNNLGFGGAEKMLTFVANQLTDRGNKCYIIDLNAISGCYNDHKQPVSKKIEIYKLPEVPQGKNKHIFRIEEIKRIVKNNPVDVMVAFTGYPNMYACVVGKILNIPSIMSERGDPRRTAGSNVLKEALFRFIVNQSKGGVFQTSGAMDYYSKSLRKRSTVIPNPIFINQKIPHINHSDRRRTIVSVGRLDNEQKRYDVMLDAFAFFHVSHQEYKLLLYGKGRDEDLIREWIMEKGLSESVVLKGLSTKPMLDIFSEGIFIITSDYEGISNSLLEAMAVGLPCVSTDHTPGGARLLITDHENGLLTPIGDSKAIAKALAEFTDNPELAEKCGKNAKDVLVRFAPNHIIDQWEKYIETIVRQS